MSPFLRQTLVIARRDFLAVAGTPTFLLFLLAPLLMIGIAFTGGSGASSVAQSAAKAARIAWIATPENGSDLKETDKRLRSSGGVDGLPMMDVIPAHGDDRALAIKLFGDKSLDYFAVAYGALEKPAILHEAHSYRSASYLAEVAEQVLRSRKAGMTADASLSRAAMEPLKAERSGVGGRRATAYAAVFGIFFLTLLLAGQAVGMLAEEKSSKVIEILAAAVPLEAVFLGKLIGMFGVALLFVSFWGLLIGGGLMLTSGGAAMMAGLDPAVGMVPFLLLCAAYFTMSYMLIGAVFLGAGAQAATMREIQLLSLPITVAQVLMFTWCSSASSAPGSTLARAAEAFPFSSPMAMAARAANDAALWPHLLALGWQLLWVAIMIFFSARLFRLGVLKSGGGLKALFSRRMASR